MNWIAVAVGGALGSLARHLVNLEMSHRLQRAAPWSTFTVNIIGCVVIGLLAGRVASGRLHLGMLAACIPSRPAIAAAALRIRCLVSCFLTAR